MLNYSKTKEIKEKIEELNMDKNEMINYLFDEKE